MRTIPLKFEIFIFALVLAPPQAAFADLLAHSYEFDSKVLEVNEFGLLNIDGFGTARLWGLVPINGFVEFVEQNLVGQRIRCDDAGATFTYKLKAFDDVRKTISCASDLSKSVGPSADFENRSQTLQEFLIGTGIAVEFCAETLGVFGHCE